MTDYSARSLDTLTYSARSLDTLAWSGRGELDTTFCTTGTQTATDTTGPTISSVHANVIGLTVVEIDWNTNEDANCQVVYGTAGQTTNVALLSIGAIHEHYVRKDRKYRIEGLTAYTYYYFYTTSVDRYGNSASTGYYKLRTASTDTTGVAPTQV